MHLFFTEACVNKPEFEKSKLLPADTLADSDMFSLADYAVILRASLKLKILGKKHKNVSGIFSRSK